MKMMLKIFCGIVIAALILLFGLYFAFTNSYFLKTYLLPAISNATGVRIAAQKVVFLPFTSEIQLHKFAVQMPSDTKLMGKSVDCDYSFWDLFKGNIKINNLSLDGVALDIKSGQKYLTDKGEKVIPLHRGQRVGKHVLSWVKFEINNLQIKNSNIKFKFSKPDKDDISELCIDNVNISCPQLTDASEVKITYNFSFRTNKGKMYEINGDKVSGSIDCFIGKNWSSVQLNLSAIFDDVSGRTGALRFSDKKLKLGLLLDYLDNEVIIKDFVFKDLSSKEGRLANINLNGSIFLNPFKAQINIKECLLPSDILDIIGVLYGIDFEHTEFNYSGRFSYSKDYLESIGALNLSSFSISREGFKFFADNLFNISFKNNFRYDFLRKTIEADALSLVVNNKNKTIINLSLPKKSSLMLADEESNLQLHTPAINLNINNFDLSILENIAGRYFGIKLLDGVLNTKLEARLNGDNNTIKIKSNTDISKLNLRFNNEVIRDLDLHQNVDAKIVAFKNLILEKVETTLSTNSKKVAQLETNGKIGLKNKSGKIHLGIKNFFVGSLNDMSVSIIKNVLGIKTLFLDGFINYDYTAGGRDFVLETKLRGDDLSFYETKNAPKLPLISSTIEGYLVKKKDEITLKKFICNLNAPSGRLANLAVDGKLCLQSSTERTKLKIFSEGMALKELIKIFNSIEGVFVINLKDTNFDADFYLQKVTYVPHLTLDGKANASMNNGFLKVDPISITVNNAPVSGTVKYDFNADENNYFYVAADASNIDLPSLLRAFGSDIYSKSKGTISSFSTEMEGKGFTTEALEQSFKGKLEASLENISLPDNTSQFDYIRLVFIPIEVIAQVNSLFGDINLPFFFNNLIQYSNDIFSQTKNLNLTSGRINLLAKNGKVNIDECTFVGDGNPLRKLKFNGSIGFDRSIDINAIVKINQIIIIPLHIGGTVSKPNPNLLSLGAVLEDDFAVPAGKGMLDVLTAPETITEKISDDADIALERVIP